ncbi:MAG: TatD family hydrolase [Candidatus Omnitrophica bacterium]|nr:TatD family hydrolase [Candidatus Omnitrophota bacterium]
MNNEIILFDSHLHLNHEDFKNREAEVWMEAYRSGVKEGVVIGVDLPSSRTAVEWTEKLPGLYASVGISPHDVMKTPDHYIDELRRLAEGDRVVAIGECGLEYHYPVGPKEKQIEYFLHQIDLAREMEKILIIHLREADDDFLRILDKNPPASAIIHCFTASQTIMEAAVEFGYYISFSGIATFKNAKDLQKIVPQVPDENLLIETDAPYLAPVPYRGKICEPKMIINAAQKIAELRNVDIESIAQLTRKNARRAFKLDEKN